MLPIIQIGLVTAQHSSAQKNGIAPLDGNGTFSGIVSGAITGSIQSTFSSATTVSIIAGGANYKVGDTVQDDHGGSGTVTSVDSSGGVTGYSISPSLIPTSDISALRRPSSTSGSGYNFAFKYTQSSQVNFSLGINELTSVKRYLNLRGLSFDGTDTTSVVAQVFASLPNYAVYDVSSSTNTFDVTSSGVTGNRDYLVNDSAHKNNYYGDGSILATLDQGLTYRRNVESNTDWAANQMSSLTYGYVGSNDPTNQKNLWVNTVLGKDHKGNVVDSRGNMTALQSDLESFSFGDAHNFDTNAVFTNIRHGSDWQWANLSVIHEPSSQPFIWFNTQEWLGEWDWGGWGEDGGPNDNRRHSLMITGWQVGGGFNHNWQASHAYNVNDQIQITVNGVLCSATVITAGTTGSTTPDWSTVMANAEGAFSTLNTTNIPTVTDGTVVWRYNGIMRMTIDNAMIVSYQPDSSHNQDADLPANEYGHRTPMLYHSFLKTDAVFDTAILNFASAQWPLNSTAVWARVPKDFYIDLGATYNSTSTNNDNLFGYDSSSAALVYKHSGNTVFAVSDSGSLSSSQINTNGESHFAAGTFSDPDVGSARDAKFGNKGIAVSGGIKTDTINVTSGLTAASLLTVAHTYATLPSSPVTGQHVFCSDCYSKLREDGDTATGILVYWNGTRWNDVLGLQAQH